MPVIRKHLVHGASVLATVPFVLTGAPIGPALSSGEPLAAVCTNVELEHHRSCEVGYLAMYIPHGSTSDCLVLYYHEVGLHPTDSLLEDDFVAGCEAAKRERIALGVARGLDP